jgi:hypothetical protein
MTTRGGVDGVVAHWLLDRMSTVLTHWHALRTGAVDRAQFLAAVGPLREGFRAPLEWGCARGSRTTPALCRALLANWESLWAWQMVDGGEADEQRRRKGAAPRRVVAEEPLRTPE